jgi:5-oxoprolinase (ATP-hydrolysing) subunit C
VTELVIESCGPAVSIQDGGRQGWERIGVARSGALDRLALAAANALVGNLPFAAAIEFLAFGAKMRLVGGPVRFALAGADMPIFRDGEPIPSHTSFLLHAGQRLSVGHTRKGVCSVLAVEGSINVPDVLGAKALHARAEFGGLDGKTLAPGDRLTLNKQASPRTERRLDPLPLGATDPIRLVLGPQADQFGSAARALFLGSEFMVTPSSDRMGYRLSGPIIRHRYGHNIISDGVAEGAVQVPGSGQPIVMLADRQTTGGYPKIATVITADLRLVANRQAGQKLHFAAITIEHAQQLLRQHRLHFERLPRTLQQAHGTAYQLDDLTGANLAGCVVNAVDPDSWHCDDLSGGSGNR